MWSKESYVLQNVDMLSDDQRRIDEMLYEAVEKNCTESVLTLLRHTVGEHNRLAFELTESPEQVSKSSITLKWKKKINVKAVILAAQRSNPALIHIFLSHGFRIEQPHDILCRCWVCKNNMLGNTKACITTYSALCDPVWISLSSKDPFATSFSLTRELARLEKLEDSYENVFSVLRVQVQTYCMDLLDCIETSAEQYKIINMVESDHYDENDVINGKWSLRLLKLAFQYKLKKIVAHPVIQHVVTSLVYDSVPEWRLGGRMSRFFYVITKSAMFPFTALAYMFFPCTSVSRSSQAPLVKFINGASSFVTFLGLLALLSALPARGLRSGKPPSALEWVILIWIISLLVAEITQLSQVGRYRYFTSGWNLMDVFMIFFMLTSFAVWIVLLFVESPDNTNQITTVRSIANGLFTCGTIMSFFRLVYLCQITRFLGLLQLCLGKMIEVIFQFAFISCVVLWSFSVGMVFLHNSLVHKSTDHSYNNDNRNKSEVQVVLSKGFDGLPTTMVTLAWASLNMVGLTSLEDFDDGGVVYLWSSFLFTLYYGVSMIVLLNMLIAMMSNSYQQIENNIEVEHKYAKTQLWIDYIISEAFLPCPFNLLPTWAFFKRLVTGNAFKKKDIQGRSNHNEESEYKKTARNLIRRYLQRKHKVDLDAIDNYKRGHGVQNEEVLAKVHDYIEEARKQQGAVLQKTASFEDSGLDISFNGSQTADSSYAQNRT